MDHKKKKRHRFRNIVDSMVPDEYLEADYDLRRRSRLTINFTLALTALGPVYALLYWLKYQLPQIGALIFLMAVVALVGVPTIFQKLRSIRAAVNFLLGCYFSLLLVLATYSGGMMSATMPWLATVPILGVMLLGPRAGVFWAAMGILTGIGFFITNKLGIPLPHEFSEQIRFEATMFSIPGIILIILVLVNLYETAKNDMLSEIEQASKKVEFHRSLAEKAHQRARLVLDSVDQGFVMVDRDGTMNAEHSTALEKLIEKPEQGQKIWEYFTTISPEAANWFEMAWFQLEMNKLPPELILSQIPEMCKVSHHQYLSVKCQFIEATNKILVVITDVSEKVKAEQTQELQSEIIAIIQRVTSYGSVFYESIDELQTIIDRLNERQNDRDMQKLLLHTLKGSSAVSGMISIPRIVHDLETKLEESNDRLDQRDILLLVEKWNDLMEKVEPFLKSRNKLRIEVTRDDFDQIKNSLENNIPNQHIINQLDAWLREPTQSRLRQAAEHAEMLAKKLHKPKPNIEIVDHGIRLEGERWRSFWSCFSHAVRNAMDHGIETTQDRISQGKNSNGALRFETYIDRGEFVISIADDGKGIDWEKVKLIAEKNNLPSANMEDLKQALFTDGLSTKDEISQFSGRGVGMTSLNDACNELGGLIEIDSAIGQGTKLSFRFPIDSNYVFAA